MKDVDLLLWGATGYTGRLVAARIAERAPPGLVWALGGRRRGALESLREELGVRAQIIVGDASDPASIGAVVSRCRVVATTVGPYARFGLPLLAAAVESGTHVCDLTGELTFVHESIRRHHRAAAANRTRIVHCCGFDSVPSDLGCWLLNERFGPPGEVLGLVVSLRGSYSGGTAASAMQQLEAAQRDPEARRVLRDPYSLNPDDGGPRPPCPDRLGPRYEPLAERWTSPFAMAIVNTRVVRRSHALLDYAYGDDFAYRERASARGRAQATRGALGLVSLGLVGSTSIGRRLLRRVGRSPGEGPTEEQRERGRFRLRFISHAGTVEMSDDVDPGYASTSKMLAESALSLAVDPLSSPGGVLTPAVAMGDHLVRRLSQVGIVFG